jgi:hypothetical protein
VQARLFETYINLQENICCWMQLETFNKFNIFNNLLHVRNICINKIGVKIWSANITPWNSRSFILLFKHISTARLWHLKSWAPNLCMVGLRPLLGVRLRAARGNITLRGIPTCLNYCVIFIVYTIYKCSRQPQYTTKRGAGFETHAVTSFLLISALCHVTHKQTTRLVCARRRRLNFLPR